MLLRVTVGGKTLNLPDDRFPEDAGAVSGAEFVAESELERRVLEDFPHVFKLPEGMDPELVQSLSDLLEDFDLNELARLAFVLDLHGESILSWEERVDEIDRVWVHLGVPIDTAAKLYFLSGDLFDDPKEMLPYLDLDRFVEDWSEYLDEVEGLGVFEL